MHYFLSAYPGKIVFLGCLLLMGWPTLARAQQFPEVPNSIVFGNISVKLDNGARRTIETEVRNLMANKRYWDDKMDRAVLYFPILEGILIEEEVPVDFKYLAVQESSLSPDAISSSNAVGFWQFKKETAVEMGLRVDNEIDERKSLNASTHAAVRYLKRSNQQFNNWVASLYSYYLGMGGVSNSIPSNWAYAREVTLTNKTDIYVLRFFAHKIAIEAAFDQHRTANTIVLLEYRNGRGQSLNSIANEMNVDMQDIRRYNRWLESNTVPSDKEYVLALPVASTNQGTMRQRLAESNQTPGSGYNQSDIGFPILRKANVVLKGKNNPDFYQINSLPGVQARPGDNAAMLAKAAKMSTSTFLKYNDLGPRDQLIAGDVYYLAKKNRKAMVPFHTVRQGETIRNISQIYGVRTKDILKYNRIPNINTRLQTGRVMWLMEKRPANKPIEILNQPTDGRGRPPQPDIIAADTKIPQNASERKKYTPKLANAEPSPVPPASKSEEVAKPTQAPPVETPPVAIVSSPEPLMPAKAESNTSDRVVVISRVEADVPSTPKTTSPTPSSTETRTNSSAFENERPAAPSTRKNVPSSERSAPLRTEPTSTGYHVVESGQTYYSISRQYTVKISDLLNWNGLTLNDKLSVGQRLVVNKPAGTLTSPVDNRGSGEYTTHTVSSGETLFSISKQYGVSIAEIQRANSMSDYTVKLGQNIKIPKR